MDNKKYTYDEILVAYQGIFPEMAKNIVSWRPHGYNAIRIRDKYSICSFLFRYNSTTDWEIVAMPRWRKREKELLNVENNEKENCYE